MFGKKKEDVFQEALEKVKKLQDPELHMSLDELGMIKDAKLEGDTFHLSLALTVEGCPLKDQIQGDVQRVLAGFPSIKSVRVYFLSMSKAELEALKQRLGAQKSAAIASTAPSRLAHDAGGINRLEKKAERIIAITSGKGGVGKSSVTSLLAIALSRLGQKVGILDADITGPSIARIFGTKEKPMVEGEDTLVPVETASGVKILSMNLLISDESAPVIWRGPLINGAIRQLYANAAWEGLDYLLVDLPPGTSDANLTVFQSIPLDGVVIVSSPQELVKMIVGKSIAMAKQLRVPVLGLVENMAYLPCPHCQEVIRPYGPSQGQAVAQASQITFLASMPIDANLALACDQGKIQDYSSPELAKVAEKLVASSLSKV